MTLREKTPTLTEVTRVIVNDAYHEAVKAVSGMRLMHAAADTFTIGPGTATELTIRRRADGTLDIPKEAERIRLRHYPSKSDITVFQKTWNQISTEAFDAISKHTEAALSSDAIDHISTETYKQYSKAAKGARSTLKLGYLHNPSGVGYKALADFLGRDHIKTTIAIAGRRATLKEFNIVTKHRDILSQAKAMNPNAVLMWFKKLHATPQEHIAPISPLQVITQAKQAFVEALRKVNPEEEPGPLWNTAALLNHEAVARYLDTNINVVQIAMLARQAKANPSFTAIRTLASLPSHTDTLAGTLVHAFIRESERSLRSGRHTQAELASRYTVLENPYMAGLTRDLTQTISAIIRDLKYGRPNTQPIEWDDIVAAIPQDILDILDADTRSRSKKKHRSASNTKKKHTSQQDLDEILQGPANAALEDALQHSISIECKPGHKVTITQHGQPSPALTVWRNTDGTINHMSHDYFVHGPLPNPRDKRDTVPNWTSRGMKVDAATRMVAQHLETNREADTQAKHPKPPKNNRLNTYIHNRLRESGYPTDNDLSHLLTAGITSLVDQEVYDISQNIAHSVDIDTYNLVAPARKVMAELLRTNPGAITWAMTTDHKLTNPPEHPSEVITAVKTALTKAGMSPASWRTIATMSPDIVKTINADAAHEYADFDDPYIDQKAFLINAIAKSQKTPSTETTHAAVTVVSALLGYRPQATLTKVEHHNAQTFLVLLLRENQPPTAEDTDTARDYVHHLNVNNKKLHSTTWSGLRKASQAWHRDIRRTPIIETWERMMYQQNNLYRAWPIHLGEHTDDGHTIRPLSNEYDLYQESLRMEHCVIGYGVQCAYGTSRIFSITDAEGTNTATAELRSTGQEWAPAQTKGKHNHQVSDRIHSMAERLAARYTNTQPQQFDPWWVHVTTGEKFTIHPQRDHIPAYA